MMMMIIQAALEHAFKVTSPKDHILVLHDQPMRYKPTGYYGETEPVTPENVKRESDQIFGFAREKCMAANRDCEWILNSTFIS